MFENGPVAQLGAHHIRIVGVVGSNPIRSTNRKATLRGGFSIGMAFILSGFEQLNATRMSVAGEAATSRTLI